GPALPSGRALRRLGSRRRRAGTVRARPVRSRRGSRGLTPQRRPSMSNKQPSKAKQVALSGMLFAMAMALSFIEGSLTFPGLLPGMKLGLANVVVMYALLFMGVRQALILDLLKALFVFLVSGPTAGFLSLCGGLLSLLVMWLLYDVLPFRPTWFILSVSGAFAHNVGQLIGAGIIIS